eukprot:6048853-Prorocentrum_lima.AAC.1
MGSTNLDLEQAAVEESGFVGSQTHQQSSRGTSRSLREYGTEVEIDPQSGACQSRTVSDTAGPFGRPVGAEVGGTCGKDAHSLLSSTGLEMQISTVVGLETGPTQQKIGTQTKWSRTEPTSQEIQNLKMGGHPDLLLWKW